MGRHGEKNCRFSLKALLFFLLPKPYAFITLNKNQERYMKNKIINRKLKIRVLIRKILKRKFTTNKICTGSLESVFKNTAVGSLDLHKVFELKSYRINLQEDSCWEKKVLKVK